ncbi:hypothetical protein HYALB_00007613 [Hymenoscyphus albidus]|uniref:ABC transporter domain-containing protein n=1 Tax=Hymenoscyphus albidus TaxID=595503 RepID=A0A9N9LLW2_9HELO|nr:hypothetical protein HYALB_00007613 [Hymenoscyphus albidus]
MWKSPFLGQVQTLIVKNVLIALRRHPISTTIRAFLLPIAFVIFLSYARNLFIPPSNFGIGSPSEVRSLGEGLDAATGGRHTVAFVDNGRGGGDIGQVIDLVAQQVTAAGKDVVRLQNEVQLLDACRSSLRGATSCYGGVVFESSPTQGTGGIWNYTLRADGAFGSRIDVEKTTNDVQIFLLPLQRAVDHAILTINASTAAVPLPNNISEYPFTSITQEQRNINIRVNYQGAIINILAIAFLIAMVGVSYHLTGFIASERELGISQLIEAMMPNKKRWQPQVAQILAYHFSFDLIYLPGWIISGIVIGLGVFAETSMAIIIIYHILAGFALTSFSILGASFFKKAQLSGISVALATLLLGVLAQVIDAQDSGTVAVLSLLFTPCNYVFFLIFIARYERQKMATDLIHSAPQNPWELPGIALWVFIILQIFLYPLIGAWVSRILYGTASKGRIVEIDNQDSHMAARNETVSLQDFSKHYPTPWLRRRFMRNPKPTAVAVNGLNLSARQGEICVLLGANGSGKSTTLDSIAGLNTVTSGTITVNGKGGLGIAPQKNVLWDEVTVEEHVRIFNHLKSPLQHDSKEALKKLVEAVDLDRKVSAKSKTLSEQLRTLLAGNCTQIDGEVSHFFHSEEQHANYKPPATGGQKRKLQLAIMFTGGSAVCCIDEVSSGLDPLSRRKIWDILLAERGSRTLILTTHFLDEADLLADKMFILSKGTLRAQGTSVELKEKLGGGYRIHLHLPPGQTSPHIKGVERFDTFGQATYTASTSGEAALIIKCLDKHGLSEYELSGPTIEDVFLQLADEAKSPLGTVAEKAPSETTEGTEERVGGPEIAPTSLDTLGLYTGKRISPFRQCWVLFRKRYTILKRNYLPYICAFLLPVTAAGLVTLFLKDFRAVGCSPVDRSRGSDVESLSTISRLIVVLGPSSKVSLASARALFQRQLPGPLPPDSDLGRLIQIVDTFDQFNNYINTNFTFVRPAGVWLGDNTSPPTVAYLGDRNIYFGMFGLNILDSLLTNVSISTQYAEFDIPWVPGTGKSLQLVVYFGLALAVYPGFFALYPTIERIRNIRDLEYSNGVRSLPLWLAHLGFDFIFVLVSSAVSLIIFAVDSSAWYHDGYLFLIFALYGMASILLAYVVSLFARTTLSSFAFAVASQAVLLLIYLIGYLVTITYAPINRIDDLLLVVNFVVSIVMPIGNVVRALFIALNLFSTTCSGRELSTTPGGILQYGGPILYLIIQILFLFAILLWYDSGSILAWYRRVRGSPPVEPVQTIALEEQADELERISSTNDGLRVLGLTKSFGRMTAVENLNFGIKRGEVFALLGPNGAGKSTTISLIRGDIQPSKNGGKVFVSNIDISAQRAKARAQLGVCPQFDATDVMTTREHLQFYGRVRGVQHVESNVSAVLKAVGLIPFASRMASQLSGGNKRKLSLGIALIGNPSVLLLDEPSSGMDAAAKRQMWSILSSVVPGRSLLLTTHSMEEADALATRAGIMAKRMLAVGTTGFLRRTHGGRLFVHLVLGSAPHTGGEEIEGVRRWIGGVLGGAEVEVEERTFHGQVRFSVCEGERSERSESVLESMNTPNLDQDLDGDYIHNSTSTSTSPSTSNPPLPTNNEKPSDSETGRGWTIGSLITFLEDHSARMGIRYYAVSRTTLDQVFLGIVGGHGVEEEGYVGKRGGVEGWWVG